MFLLLTSSDLFFFFFFSRFPPKPPGKASASSGGISNSDRFESSRDRIGAYRLLLPFSLFQSCGICVAANILKPETMNKRGREGTVLKENMSSTLSLDADLMS